MNQTKIDRINYLAKKAKTQPLTTTEKEEQKKLRIEYVSAFRSYLTNILNNTYIQKADGTKAKVTRKTKNEK